MFHQLPIKQCHVAYRSPQDPTFKWPVGSCHHCQEIEEYPSTSSMEAKVLG